MSDHHRDELMEMAELLLTAGKATGKLTWPSLGMGNWDVINEEIWISDYQRLKRLVNQKAGNANIETSTTRKSGLMCHDVPQTHQASTLMGVYFGYTPKRPPALNLPGQDRAAG